jgi:hypothetical protein
MRHFQLQHHDGDDDGKHAVAERLEPVLFHAAILPERQLCRNLHRARFP